MTAWNHVQMVTRDGVATIIYSERRLNVLHTAGLEELLAAGQQLRRMEGLRLVVLTGAGEKAFMGGADISEMAQFTPTSAQAFITRIHQVCHMLRTLPVPSIARVNGYCLGAGMEVAAACDLRIGADTSHYGMPEVQVGLPSVVEAALLPSLIGWGRTRELLYTGRMIDAAFAHQIGFLQRIAPLAELDAAMADWVRDICSAEPLAVTAQKRLIEGWLDGTGVPAAVQAGLDAFQQTYQTDAPNQRLGAFLKRG